VCVCIFIKLMQIVLANFKHASQAIFEHAINFHTHEHTTLKNGAAKEFLGEW